MALLSLQNQEILNINMYIVLWAYIPLSNFVGIKFLCT